MKRIIAGLLLAASLGACATTDRSSGQGPWLVGTWLMVQEGTEFPDGCASDLPIRYDPDGTYAYEDERGTWRLDGDRLTETLVSAREPAHPEAGRPYASTVVQSGPGEFRKTYTDGETVTFRRCPDAL